VKQEVELEDWQKEIARELEKPRAPGSRPRKAKPKPKYSLFPKIEPPPTLTMPKKLSPPPTAVSSDVSRSPSPEKSTEFPQPSKSFVFCCHSKRSPLTKQSFL
jgi:hypothetical protein